MGKYNKNFLKFRKAVFYGPTKLDKTERRAKILIVDDGQGLLRLFENMLDNCDYNLETAKNGLEAIEKAKEISPDLILMDFLMPEMDGCEACTELKKDPLTQRIPVVIVTSLEDTDAKLKGLAAGANDFLTKPVDEAELILRIKNLLKVKEFEDTLLRSTQILESEVRKGTYDLRDALDEVERAYKKIKGNYIETINRLTLAAEHRDEDTASHIKRVSYYCKAMSEQLRESDGFIETIFYASPMHDIGKIGIPDRILLKPGKLTHKEFETMKSHTTIGAKILGNSTSDFIKAGEIIALTHHEKWDGTGYPRGLKGDKIPLMGRIMHLVDQYDSLRSKRPYKPNINHDKVVEIIIKGDGRTTPYHFDPRILQAFKETHKQFEEIYKTHKD